MQPSPAGLADRYLVWIVGLYAAFQTLLEALVAFRHGETGDAVTWFLGAATIFGLAFFLETLKDRRAPL